MRNQPSTQARPPAGRPDGVALPPRTHTTVRAVAAAWRRLTTDDASARRGPGRPTLIACSAGGDSSALVLALAAAAGRNAAELLTVAHILHDLRPAAQARADRDRAAALASAVNLPFVEAAVNVRDLPGNAEANARRARYAALTTLARERNTSFIATAHNSHDQAETVLMNLLRGSGPRGLSGAAASRRLSPALTLIRPMLGISPTEARALCDQCRWTYALDQTNTDTTRLRNAIRADILPRLLKLRPGAEHRIAQAAEQCKQAADAVSCSARELLRNGRTPTGFAWPRQTLRRASPAVLAEALRRAAASVAGPRITDRLPARTLTAATRLIRSQETDPKALRWSGAKVKVNAHSVQVSASRAD